LASQLNQAFLCLVTLGLRAAEGTYFPKKRVNIALSSVKAVLRGDNNQAQLRFLGKIGSIHCYFKNSKNTCDDFIPHP